MSQRVVVLAALGIIVLGAAGYFTYAKLAELEGEVARLDQQLTAAEQQLSESEARATAAARAATAAQSRAEAAEARATQSLREAETAAVAAAEAEDRARDSASGRELAERARVAAERARQAAEADSANAQQLAEEAREAEAAATEQARAAREETDRIRRQREVELNRMQEALDTIVETRRTAMGMVLNLGSDRVEFEFDKAELRPEERELLARIAGVLIASADRGFAIQVFGHTDDVGSPEYNQGLSERRAGAVMNYLVEAGVNPDILTMRGMGKSMPLVAETTDDARARNRRVEIAIVDTLIDFRPARD